VVARQLGHDPQAAMVTDIGPGTVGRTLVYLRMSIHMAGRPFNAEGVTSLDGVPGAIGRSRGTFAAVRGLVCRGGAITAVVNGRAVMLG
jgi:hypothetical protein